MRTFVAQRPARRVSLRARLACSFIPLVRRQQRRPFCASAARLTLRTVPASFADEISNGADENEKKEQEEKVTCPELAQDRGHQLADNQQNKRIQGQPQQSRRASLGIGEIAEPHSRNLPKFSLKILPQLGEL